MGAGPGKLEKDKVNYGGKGARQWSNDTAMPVVLKTWKCVSHCEDCRLSYKVSAETFDLILFFSLFC